MSRTHRCSQEEERSNSFVCRLLDRSKRCPTTASTRSFHKHATGDQNSIQEESRKGLEISKITKMLKQGSWPAKPEGNMRDWKALRHALSTQDGCLYFRHRIVIPKFLRGIVLKQLHKGHPGMTRMKMLARG
ncbi:hypothetical protein TELCIR_00108 [Teladorsagia circumcincta]|uniref:Integrase zinc-binding domain-containing protein n=1 Tax=Teladorsagia circumcincta TaxID=45464 RepID=A0A2G9V5H8_TELCI|nr:hypothetical protein TELCIR_00108 [Teladorsagia circumcincta]